MRAPVAGPAPAPAEPLSPDTSGGNAALTGDRWRRANREFLDHSLSALRLGLAAEGRRLRRETDDDPLRGHRYDIVSDGEFERISGGTGRRPADDAEVAELERRRGIEEEVAAAKGRALREAGSPTALEVLSDRLGLAAMDRWTLLAAAAAELEPGFARLYAYVNDRADLTGPTPALLDRLWRGDRSGPDPVLRTLLPGGRLTAWDLVRMLPTPPGQPLAATPIVSDVRVALFLAGVHCRDPRVSHVLRDVPACPTPEAHDALAGRLARWIAGSRGPTPVLQLVGRPGSGRRTLAARTAAGLGMTLLQVDLDRVPAGEAATTVLRPIAREAVLRPAALYVDAGDASRSADGRLALAQVRMAIERLPVLLFVGTRDALEFERRGLAVPVPELDGTARRALLRRALGPTATGPALEPVLEAAGEQFALGPETATRAAAMAREQTQLAAGRPAPVEPAQLWNACRTLARADLDDLAQLIEPTAAWDDLVVPPEIGGRLRELAAQVAQRPKVYGEWGFGRRLARGRGIAALFSGPSGTGKTLAAEVMARHLDLDLYRVDLAGTISKYIGETERNLRRIFEAAEAGGGILFFDEADALFGRRTEVRDSHDRYANVEVDYLLQRMEDYRGLAILATNRKTALDRAFLRRLRFVVEFPFPDAALRRSIWRRVFPPETPLEAIDVDALGRLELSGGNIRNVALNAAFLAAEAGASVAMAHLAAAARAEYAKCEKAMTGVEIAVLEAAEGESR